MTKKDLVKTKTTDNWKKTLDVWNEPAVVKSQLFPKLNNVEFGMLMGIAKTVGANPFLAGEIWALVFKKKDGTPYPATIFLGRNFYRRFATEHKNYNGHTFSAVHENDNFCFF